MPSPSGVVDPNRIFDGFATLEGGVDGGREANLIEANQMAAAENIAFRGGRASTRPGIRLIGGSELLSNPSHSYNPNGTDAGAVSIPAERADVHFDTGVFQAARYYAPPFGQACIMILIDGRLFRFTPTPAGSGQDTIGNPVKIIDDLPIPTRLTSGYAHGWLLQADKFLIAQDGICAPVIYDGVTARHSKTQQVNKYGPEVPVGTIMSYGLGRIVVVINGDQNIRFGDLYGSHADSISAADSIIRFEETTFLAEGFDAALPFEMGKATGLTFFPQLDTSTGNGQLLAFAEKGAAAFFLDLPRTSWQTSQFQQLALLSTGLRGDKSISAVNEDLWFRSDDGWRTFRQARSEASGWAHIPLSTNIRPYVDNDTPELLKYTSSIYFDNRLIGLAEPEWNMGRPVMNRMVVCDFDILSSFGTRNKPAWDGTWTLPNVKFTQVVTGVFNGEKRAFIFGVDQTTNKNTIYELSLDDGDDFSGPVQWTLITRAFDFSKSGSGSSVFNESEVYDADIWLSEMSSVDTPISIFYKPDNYASWIQWKTYSSKFGLIGFPQSTTPGAVPTATEGFAPRVSFGKPSYRGDFQNTNRSLRRGYQFQVMIQGSGHVRIDQFRIHAQKTVERFRSVQPPAA